MLDGVALDGVELDRVELDGVELDGVALDNVGNISTCGSCRFNIVKGNSSLNGIAVAKSPNTAFLSFAFVDLSPRFIRTVVDCLTGIL